MKGEMRGRCLTLRVSELPTLNAEQRAGDHSYEGHVAWNDHPVVDAELYALNTSGVQTEAAGYGRDGDEAAAEGTQPFG